jgi:hypothetical protein
MSRFSLAKALRKLLARSALAMSSSSSFGFLLFGFAVVTPLSHPRPPGSGFPPERHHAIKLRRLNNLDFSAP